MAFIVKRPEVGGSTATTVSGGPKVFVYGSRDTAEVQIDGMSVMAGVDNPGTYASYDNMIEMTYSLGGGSAEQTSGALNVNMIPRQGGNTFSGDATFMFANHAMQGSNINDELRQRGVVIPPGLDKTWDFNADLGGRIVRDKLWFFASWRDWAFNQRIADAFNPDGSQAAETNHLYNLGGRLTSRSARETRSPATTISRSRTSAATIWSPAKSRRRARSGTRIPGRGMVRPSGLRPSHDACSSNLGGGARTTSPSGPVPAGSQARDLLRGFRVLCDRDRLWRYRQAGPDPQHPVELVLRRAIWLLPSQLAGAVLGHLCHRLSRVQGGGQQGWGIARYDRSFNGDLVQLYRNGRPDSVQTRNSPNVGSQTNFKYTGLYVQDSWTTGPLTLSPGLRYDHLDNSFPELVQPAGRFTVARHFPAVSNVIAYNDFSPTVGRGLRSRRHAARPPSREASASTSSTRTVMRADTTRRSSRADTRTWNDLNGDDIAQENELGPSTNQPFGMRRNRNPDPDLKRPYNLLYSVARGPRAGALGRRCRSATTAARSDRLLWTDNLATTFDDYTLVTIPDPRNNGRDPARLQSQPGEARVGERARHQHRQQPSHLQRRRCRPECTDRRRRTIEHLQFHRRILNMTCEVDDPNSLRFCDETQFDVPLKSSFRIAGTHPLLYGVRMSAVFQSAPNAPDQRRRLPAERPTSSTARSCRP